MNQRVQTVIIASMAVVACVRVSRASARIASQIIGLRFCGMVLEPILPISNGSSTSPNSSFCRSMTS